jgi:hypothetical protein
MHKSKPRAFNDWINSQADLDLEDALLLLSNMIIRLRRVLTHEEMMGAVTMILATVNSGFEDGDFQDPVSGQLIRPAEEWMSAAQRQAVMLRLYQALNYIDMP